VMTRKRRDYRLLAVIMGILILIFMIDNKASWLGIGASALYLAWKIGDFKGRASGRVVAIACVGVLFIGAFVLVRAVSGSLVKFSAIATALKDGEVLRLGKIKAYRDIVSAWSENPLRILVGAGAANMYSRASRQFYLVRLDTMYSNPDKVEMSEFAERQSNSMGSLIQATGRTSFYSKFYRGRDDQIRAIGSGQVDTPFSPYAGLLGETGVLGFLIYMSFYWTVLKRLGHILPLYRHDPNFFPLLLAAQGFLIYTLVNSVYGPWLETGRMTTILWSLIALCFIYHEMRQRDANAATPSSRPAHSPYEFGIPAQA